MGASAKSVKRDTPMNVTDVKIKAAKPKDKAYKLTDGSGLHLLVYKKGFKYWR